MKCKYHTPCDDSLIKKYYLYADNHIFIVTTRARVISNISL